jgi:hypothetical protein
LKCAGVGTISPSARPPIPKRLDGERLYAPVALLLLGALRIDTLDDDGLGVATLFRRQLGVHDDELSEPRLHDYVASALARASRQASNTELGSPSAMQFFS